MRIESICEGKLISAGIGTDNVKPLVDEQEYTLNNNKIAKTIVMFFIR